MVSEINHTEKDTDYMISLLCGIQKQSTLTNKIKQNKKQTHRYRDWIGGCQEGKMVGSWAESHPYMTTGKTIALTRWTFLAK